MKKLFGVVVLALGVVLVGAPNALADDTFCPPPLPAGTIDNLIVVGVCFLTPATSVAGNVKIEPGGTLIAGPGVSIGGDVQVEPGALGMLIFGSIVGGNIQAKGATSFVGLQGGSRVGGDVQLEENTGSVAIAGTMVAGDVQAFKNTGRVLIDRNAIGGNLQCEENSPAPVAFFGNIVGENKEDQCAAALGF